ncbi:MAG: AgmX/PglI C-terminal domain-containing protein [Myxococcota bacterium]
MGPTESQWLFRQGDLILGPVPSKQIIDKLYSGELLPVSEVQLMGSGVFKRIVDVPDFKVHVAKAEAKKRVDLHAAEHHASQRKRLITVAAILGGVLLVLGIVVAVIGSYLAVHQPSAGSAEELAWGDITIDAPTISKAHRREDDELVDYNGNAKRPVGTTPVAVKNPTTPPPTGTTPPHPSPGKSRPGTADPDGMQMGEVDEAGINTVVARHKPSLIPCLKAVAKPGMVAKIPIEFSIAETGKVTKVWVDNPDFKNTGLQECLLEKLQAWPFKPGTSGASVNLSFNIGKKG